ncbi:extracellular solute-binding protein [Mitsuaria sp. GD03876]|uniref:extracellular solute-binding protein n=1 Tax=Mitsuaria sp. GD03876 TaxID=2975399 RepID=UPI00244B42D7|nr:extracellular solute-binding protein [Mitsuaria sp. GD03876]MDH0867394.1 extracellular solute-binding protein [Mitsuaria sp. GD03876]
MTDRQSHHDVHHDVRHDALHHARRAAPRAGLRVALRRVATAAAAFGALALAGAPAAAQGQGGEVHITLARFFGSCDAEYGQVTDPSQASSECGIITALTNRFNAREAGRIRVDTQVVEHSAYYQQLGARIVGGDLPTVSIMHASVLGDFAKRDLLQPLEDGFARDGVPVADFTPHARHGVTLGGHVVALPYDSHAMLWHINLGLMKQAGLVDAKGQAKLPGSARELLEQARAFKRATGKPYFVWLTLNDPSFFARSVLGLVAQQGGSLFPRGDQAIDLTTPAVREAVQLMRTIYAEGLSTRHMDYSAALQGFMAGAGGVMPNGTWLLGELNARAARPGNPLSRQYEALPEPTLFRQPGTWADSHTWVMLRNPRQTLAEREAGLRFLRFLNDESLAWARTGQLPARQSAVDSAAFKALPMRAALGPVAAHGTGLPATVARQSRVMGLLGDTLASIVVSGEPMDATLAKGQTRINRLLERESRFMGAAPGGPSTHADVAPTAQAAVSHGLR